jgi:hypothetical protein
MHKNLVFKNLILNLFKQISSFNKKIQLNDIQRDKIIIK